MAGKAKYFVRMKLKRHPGMKIDDIIQFFQQLATLINSGTPILQSIQLSANQNESEKLAAAGKILADEVSKGNTLYSAMEKHPKIYDSHCVQMVRIGELTGQLGMIIAQLKIYLEKKKAMRAKIVSALTYPVILSCVALGSVTVMLWKVIPTFAAFFQDMGGEMPQITLYVLALSAFVQEKGLYVIAGVVAFVFAFKKYTSTPQGKDVYCRAMFAMPGIGEFLVLSVMEKLGSNLSLLLKSGTPLLEALKTVQEMFIDNPIYFNTFGDVCESVSQGKPLADGLEDTALFMPLVSNMIRVGEETGKLPDVLDELSLFYATKVENQLLSITGALEPLIVIGMGVAVSVLLGSVYLPMFQMSSGGG